MIFAPSSLGVMKFFQNLLDDSKMCSRQSKNKLVFFHYLWQFNILETSWQRWFHERVVVFFLVNVGSLTVVLSFWRPPPPPPQKEKRYLDLKRLSWLNKCLFSVSCNICLTYSVENLFTATNPQGLLGPVYLILWNCSVTVFLHFSSKGFQQVIKLLLNRI